MVFHDIRPPSHHVHPVLAKPRPVTIPYGTLGWPELTGKSETVRCSGCESPPKFFLLRQFGKPLGAGGLCGRAWSLRPGEAGWQRIGRRNFQHRTSSGSRTPPHAAGRIFASSSQ